MRYAMMLLVSVGFVLAAAPAGADVLSVTPVSAVAMPDDESGVARVLLQFDVSGLPEGDGLRIDQAVLDWPVNGMADDAITEYALHAVTESWTASGVAAGAAPAFAEDPADLWDYSPLDYARNDGGLLRFRLEAQVTGWRETPSANYGVVIATEDLSAASLAAQSATAVLTIRYAFVD